jgi:hypothetical protein
MHPTLHLALPKAAAQSVVPTCIFSKQQLRHLLRSHQLAGKSSQTKLCWQVPRTTGLDKAKTLQHPAPHQTNRSGHTQDTAPTSHSPRNTTATVLVNDPNKRITVNSPQLLSDASVICKAPFADVFTVHTARRQAATCSDYTSLHTTPAHSLPQHRPHGVTSQTKPFDHSNTLSGDAHHTTHPHCQPSHCIPTDTFHHLSDQH